MGGRRTEVERSDVPHHLRSELGSGKILCKGCNARALSPEFLPTSYDLRAMSQFGGLYGLQPGQ